MSPIWDNLAVAVVAGLALLVPVMRTGAQLRATGGPGIAPFQLSEGDREANRILRAWGTRGHAAARRCLTSQFGVIVCYVFGLGAAALYVAARADNVHSGWLVTARSARQR